MNKKPFHIDPEFIKKLADEAVNPDVLTRKGLQKKEIPSDAFSFEKLWRASRESFENYQKKSHEKADDGIEVVQVGKGQGEGVALKDENGSEPRRAFIVGHPPEQAAEIGKSLDGSGMEVVQVPALLAQAPKEINIINLKTATEADCDRILMNLSEQELRDFNSLHRGYYLQAFLMQVQAPLRASIADAFDRSYSRGFLGKSVAEIHTFIVRAFSANFPGFAKHPEIRENVRHNVSMALIPISSVHILRYALKKWAELPSRTVWGPKESSYRQAALPVLKNFFSGLTIQVDARRRDLYDSSSFAVTQKYSKKAEEEMMACLQVPNRFGNVDDVNRFLELIPVEFKDFNGHDAMVKVVQKLNASILEQVKMIRDPASSVLSVRVPGPEATPLETLDDLRRVGKLTEMSLEERKADFNRALNALGDGDKASFNRLWRVRVQDDFEKEQDKQRGSVDEKRRVKELHRKVLEGVTVRSADDVLGIDAIWRAEIVAKGYPKSSQGRDPLVLQYELCFARWCLRHIEIEKSKATGSGSKKIEDMTLQELENDFDLRIAALCEEDQQMVNELWKELMIQDFEEFGMKTLDDTTKAGALKQFADIVQQSAPIRKSADIGKIRRAFEEKMKEFDMVVSNPKSELGNQRIGMECLKVIETDRILSNKLSAMKAEAAKTSVPGKSPKQAHYEKVAKEQMETHLKDHLIEIAEIKIQSLSLQNELRETISALTFRDQADVRKFYQQLFEAFPQLSSESRIAQIDSVIQQIQEALPGKTNVAAVPAVSKDIKEMSLDELKVEFDQRISCLSQADIILLNRLWKPIIKDDFPKEALKTLKAQSRKIAGRIFAGVVDGAPLIKTSAQLLCIFHDFQKISTEKGHSISLEGPVEHDTYNLRHVFISLEKVELHRDLLTAADDVSPQPTSELTPDLQKYNTCAKATVLVNAHHMADKQRATIYKEYPPAAAAVFTEMKDLETAAFTKAVESTVFRDENDIRAFFIKHRKHDYEKNEEHQKYLQEILGAIDHALKGRNSSPEGAKASSLELPPLRMAPGQGKVGELTEQEQSAMASHKDFNPYLPAYCDETGKRFYLLESGLVEPPPGESPAELMERFMAMDFTKTIDALEKFTVAKHQHYIHGLANYAISFSYNVYHLLRYVPGVAPQLASSLHQIRSTTEADLILNGFLDFFEFLVLRSIDFINRCATGNLLSKKKLHKSLKTKLMSLSATYFTELLKQELSEQQLHELWDLFDRFYLGPDDFERYVSAFAGHGQTEIGAASISSALARDILCRRGMDGGAAGIVVASPGTSSEDIHIGITNERLKKIRFTACTIEGTFVHPSSYANAENGNEAVSSDFSDDISDMVSDSKTSPDVTPPSRVLSVREQEAVLTEFNARLPRILEEQGINLQEFSNSLTDMSFLLEFTGDFLRQVAGESAVRFADATVDQQDLRRTVLAALFARVRKERQAYELPVDLTARERIQIQTQVIDYCDRQQEKLASDFATIDSVHERARMSQIQGFFGDEIELAKSGLHSSRTVVDIAPVIGDLMREVMTDGFAKVQGRVASLVVPDDVKPDTTVTIADLEKANIPDEFLEAEFWKTPEKPFPPRNWEDFKNDLNLEGLKPRLTTIFQEDAIEFIVDQMSEIIGTLEATDFLGLIQAPSCQLILDFCDFVIAESNEEKVEDALDSYVSRFRGIVLNVMKC